MCISDKDPLGSKRDLIIRVRSCLIASLSLEAWASAVRRGHDGYRYLDLGTAAEMGQSKQTQFVPCQ